MSYVNNSSSATAVPFELYTGHDISISVVRALTIFIACVGVHANMLLYFTCSHSQGMTSSAVGFMKGMAVVDSLALFFTGIFSAGLSALESASINANRGLCRLKGFATWQTLLVGKSPQFSCRHFLFR